MINKHIQQGLVALSLIATFWLSGCQTATIPTGTAGTTTSQNVNQAPEMVDIRGAIVTSRYNQGQVILEVENYSISPDSRYSRAFVQVSPVTQIIGPDGRTISLSELRQGQDVSVLLRGGGQGNQQFGLGIARKIWVERG